MFRRLALEKFIDRANTLWWLWARVSCIFMGAVIILIVVNVVMRRAFNAPIFGSTELICYGVLFTASFALAQCEWVDGNIRMSLILDTIPNVKRKNLLLFVINLACTIGLAICSALLINETALKFAHGDQSVSLRFPIWFFYLILSIGFVLLTLTFIAKEIITVHCIVNGLPDRNLKEYSKMRSGEDMLE
jgi:TRAP-type C4-dicarboxylate transport system permease small subunit